MFRTFRIQQPDIISSESLIMEVSFLTGVNAFEHSFELSKKNIGLGDNFLNKLVKD